MAIKKKPLALDPAKEIRQLHKEIEAEYQSSLTKAIRIGELLTRQKEALKHGGFLPWVDANMPFSQSTANRYMKRYARKDEIQLGPVPNMVDAYLLLPPKPKFVKMTNLNSVTPRNDSEQGVDEDDADPSENEPDPLEVEDVDEAESEPDIDDEEEEEEDEEEEGDADEEEEDEPEPDPIEDEPLVDDGPPIDTSDDVFDEVVEHDIVPGNTTEEVIAFSGLPKPINWLKAEEAKPVAPPKGPLRVLVIKVTGKDEGEVIEVARGSISEAMNRYSTRDGLLFYCGVGVEVGQKVVGLWKGESDEPDEESLPARWLEVLREARKFRTDETISKLLEDILHRMQSGPKGP